MNSERSGSATLHASRSCTASVLQLCDDFKECFYEPCTAPLFEADDVGVVPLVVVVRDISNRSATETARSLCVFFSIAG